MKIFRIQACFIAALLFTISCEIMPRNTFKDCSAQCKDSSRSKACCEFCDCIHKKGEALNKCLDIYESAPDDGAQKP